MFQTKRIRNPFGWSCFLLLPVVKIHFHFLNLTFSKGNEKMSVANGSATGHWLVMWSLSEHGKLGGKKSPVWALFAQTNWTHQNWALNHPSFQSSELYFRSRPIQPQFHNTLLKYVILCIYSMNVFLVSGKSLTLLAASWAHNFYKLYHGLLSSMWIVSCFYPKLPYFTFLVISALLCQDIATTHNLHLVLIFQCGVNCL